MTMTAFYGVWRFTRCAYLFGSSLTVSLADSRWALPNRATFCQGPSACGFRTAELSCDFGLKPFSVRAGTRLCVSFRMRIIGLEPVPIAFQAIALPTELNALANPIPARASQPLRRLLSDEIRRAVCRSPTGYLTEHQDAGSSPDPRSSARARSLARLALSRTTRCP